MSHIQSNTNAGVHRVTGNTYQLETMPDRPFVALRTGEGALIAELFVPSSIHTTAGQDDTTSLGPWELAEDEAGITLSAVATSSLWAKKRISLICSPASIRYELTLSGAGQLTDAHLLGGYYSGTVRWGSGFFPSAQRFLRGFTPEPSTHEQPFFAPAEGMRIDIAGVPLSGRGDWFFTPPPFCFAFEHAGGWLAMGVEPLAGQHQFTELRYSGQREAFHLSMSYEGQTAVAGETTLPALVVHFGAEPYEALKAHCRSARATSGTPTGSGRSADWWRRPIFCGWGAQCHLAARGGGRAPEYARQEEYERFMGTLAARDLEPGTVVIDDKWQATYGDNAVDTAKWPDLPGFIAGQHRLGRKVLLWLKLWDPEGLPADECVRNAAGLPVAVDPSNPRFEQRLRASVRRMLGPGGYDADGFKLDFSARIPNGPAMRRHGAAWGLELLRAYLAILADEARRAKPDALVMAHTPHPYLADLVDMIRLNDINIHRPIIPAMTYRARVAAAACPEALIDTDNWPVASRASWREYLRVQPTLGAPSLYYVDHIDALGEPLEDEDYALLREAWAAYKGTGRPI
jgi:hypothetical protein